MRWNLHSYRITIGTKQAPRLSFDVMAPSSCAAFQQHVDLCQEGERCEVTALDPLDIQRQEVIDKLVVTDKD